MKPTPTKQQLRNPIGEGLYRKQRGRPGRAGRGGGKQVTEPADRDDEVQAAALNPKDSRAGSVRKQTQQVSVLKFRKQRISACFETEESQLEIFRESQLKLDIL